MYIPNSSVFCISHSILQQYQVAYRTIEKLFRNIFSLYLGLPFFHNFYLNVQSTNNMMVLILQPTRKSNKKNTNKSV